MKVGITYDLREDYLKQGYSEEETAECDKTETIDGIDQALHALGFDTDRIGNAQALMTRLVKGDRWDIVFNIAEGFHGVARESQVPAILEIYEIPYTFSDPMVLAITLDKAMTKMMVHKAGVPTAPFAVIKTAEDISAVNLPFPLFVKPLAEGTGKGISQHSRVNNYTSLESECVGLLRKFKQPVLVETYLPGKEYTVGITGTAAKARVIGAMEIHFREPGSDIYSYHTKTNYEGLVDYSLVSGDIKEKCAELSLKAWRALDCRDGGRIDIRVDAAGTPNFIEVNPLPGLNYIHSDLPIICKLAGFDFKHLIDEIMKSALDRRKI